VYDTPPSVPAAPSISDSVSLTGRYTVSWSSVPGAVKYVLYEKSSSTSSHVEVYRGPLLSWPSPLKENNSYNYKVSACNDYVCSDMGPGAALFVMRTPTDLRSDPNPVPLGVAYRLFWTHVTTALSYDLQEKIGTGDWKNVPIPLSSGWLAGVKPVGTYQYKLRACRSSNVCTDYTPVLTVTVSSGIPPQVTAILAPTSSTMGSRRYRCRWKTTLSSTCPEIWNIGSA
ncbi:hypothetical protein, partial [Dokdonella sp.]|uniref:hypothetical protein n=1 Tax=Dokdonella sp. TaxID=2291710 RepID=UPI0026396813